MNDSEIRRKELLAKTRSLYSDKNQPAVHPRFSGTYQSLYHEEELPKNTLGIRTLICCLLFAVFAAAEYKEFEFLQVDSSQIVEEIRKDLDLDLQEVWKDL